MEINFYGLIDLRRGHAVGLLDRVFQRQVLILDQVEKCPGLRHFFLVDEVMNHHPRLRIEQSVVGAFVEIRGVMLHRQQIGEREPDLRAQKFGERLWWIGIFTLVLQQVLREDGRQFGVAADFDLFVLDANGAEIFGEAFVEPSWHRRIVVHEQQMGQVMGDGAPWFRLEEIQDDEILVFAGKKKSGSIDRLALAQGRGLVVILVVLEGENGERKRIVEAVFGQQRAENGSHLLEAQGDLFTFFFICVGDDGEVRGVDFKPRRWLGCSGGGGEQNAQKQRAKQ